MFRVTQVFAAVCLVLASINTRDLDNKGRNYPDHRDAALPDVRAIAPAEEATTRRVKTPRAGAQ